MMKKGKLFSLAAILAMFALLLGCDSSGDSDDTAGNPPLTEEFQTFYLNIAEADLGGLEGFHFKNLSDKSVGIVIDRIFASPTRSEDGAVDVFTFADPETGSKYWGFDAGTIADGVWSSGEVAAPIAPATETYITGFASSEFTKSGIVYVGIVAKNLSAAVAGDQVMFVPIITDPITDKQKTFKELFLTE
jgi:hypothetical protein